MQPRKHRTNTNMMVLALAGLVIGSVTARADPPGYDFLMFPEGMAMVVDMTGKATKAKISEETAKMLTAGAQPLSNDGIVLLYQGKLYIVPDKQAADGKMMSTKVLSSVSEASK